MRAAFPWIAAVVGAVIVGSILQDAGPGQIAVGVLFLVGIGWFLFIGSVRDREMEEKYGPPEDDPARTPEGRGF